MEEGPTATLEALKILCIANPKETENATGGSQGKKELFNCQLSSNLDQFKSFLDNQPDLYKIYQEYDTEMCQLFNTYIPEPIKEIQWVYVSTCLLSLRMLNDIIEESMKEYQHAEQKHHASLSPKELAKTKMDATGPSMSPDTLSFDQQKTISTCLQFVVSLGIMPNISPGVGTPTELRSGFADVIEKSTGERTPENDLKLIICLKTLLTCTPQPALGGIILSKYLGDLLAGICQVVFEPKKKKKMEAASSSTKSQLQKSSSEIDTSQIKGQSQEKSSSEKISEGNKETEKNKSEMRSPTGSDGPFDRDIYREYFCEQLSMLVTKVYQPALVRELLMLQGAPGPRVAPGLLAPTPDQLAPTPAWMRRACGRLLSDILIKPQGVQNVLRAMFQTHQDLAMGGCVDIESSGDWRKCDAVSRIIAHCPRNLSVQDYYHKVAPQVLHLLRIKDKNLSRHFLRVTVSTIGAMIADHRQAAEQSLITPLLSPLNTCLDDKEIPVGQESRVLVEESALTSCLDDIHKVFVLGSAPHTAPLLLPYLQPLLHLIFSIFCFSHQGVLNIRSRCLEILAAFFDHSSLQVSLLLLQALSFNHFPPGRATGPTNLSSTDLRKLHPSAILAPGGGGGVIIRSKPGSGALPLQPVEDFEIRMGCLVQLIKQLNKDEITAEFFLFLLDDLTNLIGQRIEAEKASTDPVMLRKADVKETGREGKEGKKESRVLVEIEEREEEEEQCFNRNLVVLHLLATLAEKIGPACLKSPTHILSFVQKTLERGLQVLRATDDDMMGAFESETVTMAMGMLTAVMGGATELTPEDKDNMKVLLPLLEELSQSHPDPEVQEMSKDLRIAIATRGMVWNDLHKAAQARDRSTNQVKVKTTDKVKPKTAKLETTKLETATDEKKVTGKSNQPLIEVISSEDFHPEAEKTTEASASKGINVTASKTNTEGNAQRLLEGLKGKTRDCREKSGFEQAIDELCDPLVPVRGHGLISLRKLIQKKDPETLEQEVLLCKVFKENLDHDDTYIYLSSVEGMAALADRMHHTVVPTLAAEFANFDLHQNVDLSQGQTEKKMMRKRSPELRMKIGEVLVKTSKSLGDLAPRYRDVMLGSLLTGARDLDPLVRASSVSNLGELCKHLHYSLGGVIHEILSCVSALLKSDPEPDVRKAAALLTTLLLQGLGHDVTKVMETSLRDLYRLLRHVTTVEKDELVRVHVLLALEELDRTMRELLFPPQTLTKRIRVLDAE